MIDNSGLKDYKYYNANLWSYYDSDISTNSLNIESYITINGKDMISSPKFKISISGKAATKSSITLTISEIYNYSYLLKTKLMTNLNDYVKKVTENQAFTDGFSYKAKTNIYTTIMWLPRLNSPAIRIMVGDKEQTVLETDKIYIPLIHFISFYEILNQVHANYVNMGSNVINNVIGFELVDSLNERLDKIEMLMQSLSFDRENSNSISEPSNDMFHDLSISPSFEILDSPMQNELSQFVLEKRDSFQLDIEPDKDYHNSEVGTAKLEFLRTKKNFCKDTLMGDYKNLETLISSSISTESPCQTFRDIIIKSTEVDMLGGCSIPNIARLNYIINSNIKNSINQFVSQKQKLPETILPVCMKDNTLDDDKVDTMASLFLFYLFASRTKTILSDIDKSSVNNKELFGYCLKSITGPFVFSYLTKVSEDVLSAMIVRKYHELVESGFFNSFNDDIKKSYECIITLDDVFIKNEVSRIYNSIKKVEDKLTLENFFSKRQPSMKINYEDFDTYNISVESVYKLNEMDIKFFNDKNCKLSSMSFDSTSEFPPEIMNRYNNSIVKYDNSMLVRYISDKDPSFSQLNLIKTINTGIGDILDKLNINECNDQILKALYLWKPQTVEGVMMYTQFFNMVESSSLDRAMVISLIYSSNNITDPEFLDSFVANQE